MPEIVLNPIANAAARRLIRNKPVVTQNIFDRLLPELRARVLTIGKLEDVSAMRAVREAIAEIPAGQAWTEARDRVMDAIAEWTEPDATRTRAEMVLRMHGFMAYQAAQHEVMARNTDAYPYWQYLSMDDEAVRETHAALHGLILPANHPFWQDHYPPWDYGCRCQVVPVTADDYAEAVAGGQESEFGFALGPHAERMLMESGSLDRGTRGQPVDVSTPFQRAERKGDQKGMRDAFRWNPGDLRMPIDRILERYSPDERAAFEEWARNTNLPLEDIPGATARQVTVWGWLKGEKLRDA
jgi:SPP1 gp7 family putative phage head morphogenesis protein